MAVPIIYLEKQILNNINTIQKVVLSADDNKENFVIYQNKSNHILPFFIAD